MTTKDTLTLGIILAAVPAATYFILWDPLFTGVSKFQFYVPATPATSINAYRGQIAMYDTAIKESKDLIARYQKLEASYKSVDKSIITTIQKSIPDSVEELSLVSEVTTLVSKSGLDPGKIAVTPGLDSNGIKTMILTFKVKGSYESLKNLIVSLEDNLRFMSVRSLKISPPEGESSSYIMDLQIDIYKLR